MREAGLELPGGRLRVGVLSSLGPRPRSPIRGPQRSVGLVRPLEGERPREPPGGPRPVRNQPRPHGGPCRRTVSRHRRIRITPSCRPAMRPTAAGMAGGAAREDARPPPRGWSRSHLGGGHGPRGPHLSRQAVGRRTSDTRETSAAWPCQWHWTEPGFCMCFSPSRAQCRPVISGCYSGRSWSSRFSVLPPGQAKAVLDRS